MGIPVEIMVAIRSNARKRKPQPNFRARFLHFVDMRGAVTAAPADAPAAPESGESVNWEDDAPAPERLPDNPTVGEGAKSRRQHRPKPRGRKK